MFPKKLIYQSWLSIFGAEIVAFIVTFLQKSDRNYYRVIISGLLPEAHEQYESRKDATEFVLRRWDSRDGDEIKTISKLLKPSLFLYKYGLWISLGIVISLILIGIEVSKAISSQKMSIATVESCTQEGESFLIPLQFVELQDQQSPDFDTGEFSIKFTEKGTDRDCISIFNNNDVNVNNKNITYKGNLIGTLEGGEGVNPLKIVFNTNANREAVNAVLRNIAYQYISENIEFGTRKLEFIITDGDGGVSKSLLVPIHFISNKEDIVLPNTQPIPAQESTDFSINGISIRIPEQETLNVNIEVSQGTITVKDNVVNGLTANQISGNKTLKVTLNGTVAEINKTIANGIIYRGNKDFSGEDNLTVAVNFTNSDKGLFWPPLAPNTPILSKFTRINVNPINPPPVITITNPQIITQENTKQVISGISISDPKYQNITLTLEVSESSKSKIEVNTNIPDGLPANSISNNKTNKVIIKDNITRINNILKNPNGVTYQTQNYAGQDELKIIANNGIKIGSQKISILVNDAPVLAILEPEAPPIAQSNPISKPLETGNTLTITKSQAESLISLWLKDGKKQALGSSYNQQIVSQYTTGKYRNKLLKDIQNLSKDNAFNEYDTPVIQTVGDVFVENNQVKIYMQVSESFRLFVNNRIDIKNSRSTAGLYLFTLQFEQEGWKIANVEENNEVSQ
ncbi:MAG: DUF4101 domain-containing protein [Nostoc sp. TH1S01]|nr:DUF4101 domain-containing protein [Nostoc sp. TH1S01]